MQQRMSIKFNLVESKIMQSRTYVYWRDGKIWLGYLEEFPDHWTQGRTRKELEENPTDIYSELPLLAASV